MLQSVIVVSLIAVDLLLKGHIFSYIEIAFVQQKQGKQPGHPAVAVPEGVDTKKVQNDAGDEKKLVDVSIVPRGHIGQLQLLHSLFCFRGRGRTEPDAPVSLGILLQNVIVTGFISAGKLISGHRHHDLMKVKNIRFPEINIIVIQMNLVQSVTIPGNFPLAVVQRRTVLIYDFRNSCVAGNDSFNRVGTLDRLDLRDCLKFRKDPQIFFPADTCHSS